MLRVLSCVLPCMLIPAPKLIPVLVAARRLNCHSSTLRTLVDQQIIPPPHAAHRGGWSPEDMPALTAAIAAHRDKMREQKRERFRRIAMSRKGQRKAVPC